MWRQKLIALIVSITVRIVSSLVLNALSNHNVKKFLNDGWRIENPRSQQPNSPTNSEPDISTSTIGSDE